MSLCRFTFGYHARFLTKVKIFFEKSQRESESGNFSKIGEIPLEAEIHRMNVPVNSTNR